MDITKKEISTDTLELTLNEGLERQKVSEFQEMCKKEMDDGKIHLTINLSKISFVDSSGLGSLIGLRAHAKSRHGSLTISEISPALTEIFRRSRMDLVLGLNLD